MDPRLRPVELKLKLSFSAISAPPSLKGLTRTSAEPNCSSQKEITPAEVICNDGNLAGGSSSLLNSEWVRPALSVSHSGGP